MPACSTPPHSGGTGQPRRPRAITICDDYAAVGWLSPFTNRETEKILTGMLACAGACDIGDVELHFVDDAAISRINAEYLACPGPTNIITFPGHGEMPGVIILSLDCLARECRLFGQDRETHFIRLLAHGVGHLAGLDHGIGMSRLEEACALAAYNLTRAGVQ